MQAHSNSGELNQIGSFRYENRVKVKRDDVLKAGYRLKEESGKSKQNYTIWKGEGEKGGKRKKDSINVPSSS